MLRWKLARQKRGRADFASGSPSRRPSLRAATALRGKPSERNRLRKIAADRAARERDITIPPVRDPKRRARAEKDVERFLRTYFPAKFYQPFTEDRREMIRAILHAARFGGNEALAAPRKEGKTTLTTAVMIYCILTGLLKFPLIVAANGPDSHRILNNIKHEFESNEMLLEDFPEVCAPIRALEGAPQRANMQTVDGRRTMMKWADDHVIFPTLPGSKASGAILSTRGMDAPIRGVIYRDTRPDFVLIDDPETRESAASDHQIETRRLIIEQDIEGVGGPGKTLARVMLCTLMNRKCIAATYTDREKQPSWSGRRFRRILKWPDRTDLWEEYIAFRQDDFRNGDRHARRAHHFYIKNRKAMDAGAVLANPYTFIENKFAHDGTPLEVSALQHCYNVIANGGVNGRINFDTEYQNDPPDEEGPQVSGITPSLVRSRINDRNRGVAPLGSIALAAYIDVGMYACHYTFMAARLPWRGFIIDYGVIDVHNAQSRGPEVAIDQALCGFRDELLANPFRDEHNEIVRPAVILVDAGKWDKAIFQFVAKSGHPYRASKGYGTGHPGMTAFRLGMPSDKRMVGENWFASPRQLGIEFGLDVDYWKQFTHDRFITDPESIGSLTIFGDDPKKHVAFAAHICAEEPVTEFITGKGMKTYWRVNNRNNHWLDATAGAAAALSMAGASLLATPRTPPTKQERVNARTPDGRPFLITDR